MMRRLSAMLAMIVALIGATQLILGRGDVFAVTTAVYTVALFVAAIGVLRGGPLIYLASAWGVYLGTTLAAYLDVDFAFSRNSDAVAVIGGFALTALIVMEIVGLISSIFAYRKEARS